ncbi:MAG TPA: discoidin domain-containing protein [Thermoanaerobaculia bacterium]|nr:discoidin domain-containing protein [Thermoanaerobaculia bacterium]
MLRSVLLVPPAGRAARLAASLAPAIGWLAALAAALLVRRGASAWAWGSCLALSALAGLCRWAGEPQGAIPTGALSPRASRSALAAVVLLLGALLGLRLAALDRVPHVVSDGEARLALVARDAARAASGPADLLARVPSLSTAAPALAVRWGSEPLAAARGVSAALAVAAALALFALLRAVRGTAAGLLGVGLLLGSPRFLLETQWGASEGLLAFLAAATVLLAVRAARTDSIAAAALAGVVGALALAAPRPAAAVLLLGPIVGALELYRASDLRRTLRAAAGWAGGVAAGAAALLVPGAPWLPAAGPGGLTVVQRAALLVEWLRADGSLVGGILVALVPLAAATCLAAAWRRSGAALVVWLLWAAALAVAAGRRGAALEILLAAAAAGPLALLCVRTVRLLAPRANRPLLATALLVALTAVALHGLRGTAREIERAQGTAAGKVSEVARFLAGVESVEEAWLLEPEIDPQAPQLAVLARPALRGWPGDAAELCAGDRPRLLVDPAPESELLESVAAAAGTSTVIYGQGRQRFRALVLGAPLAPPPAPEEPAEAMVAEAAAPDTAPLDAGRMIASTHRAGDDAEAARALDGDLSTRWTSGGPQRGDEWFQVDLHAPERVVEVWVDTTATPRDHPRRLELLVSTDGARFEPAGATEDSGPRQRFPLEPPRPLRALRLLQTGAGPQAWSLHELVLVAAADPGAADWGVIDRRDLVASSFRGEGSGTPAAAIDGDPQTRWDSGARQAGGEWFQIALAEPTLVSGVRLDMTHAGNDFPRGLRVLLSADGETFGAVAELPGRAPAMYVPIHPPATARWVRLEQTGEDSFYWWSIHEVELFGRAPGRIERRSDADDPDRFALPWDRGGQPPRRLETLADLPCRLSSSGALGLRAEASDPAALGHRLDPSTLALSSWRSADRALGNAIDGNPATRWDSGGPQQGGEWVEIDLGWPATLSKVVLDTRGSPGDHPRRLQVSASIDGALFEPVALTGAAEQRLEITLTPAVRCRALRLEQLGADPGRFWSIHELELYGVYDAGAPAARGAAPGRRHLPLFAAAALLLAGVVWALGAHAGAVAAPSAVLRRSASSARRWIETERRTGLGVAAAIALAGVVAALLVLDVRGWPAFVAWLLAIAAGIGAAALGRERRGRLLSGWEWLLVVLLAAVAAFFRLHRLDEQPAGLWIDELRNASHAIALAAGDRFDPFGATPLVYADWVKTSNLYLYFTWCVLWLGGVTKLAVKLVSIVPGVAAVPWTYLHGRRFLPWPAAAVAAGGLALSLWQVTLSRWGWDEVLVTALVVVGFAWLWDALTHRDRFSFALSGGVLGLALYGYIAARLAIAAALFAIVADAALRRDRRWARSLAWFGFGGCLVALPLALYWLSDPGSFMVRVNELSILDQVLDGDFEVLIQSVRAHLLMFHVRGDANARHNLPGEPMLDPWIGALFLVGLLASIARIRRPESLLLLPWIAFGLLGGILSGLQEAPQGYRTGIIAPACYLLAGIGLRTALELLCLDRRRWGLLLSAPAVAVLLAASGAWTYRRYFEARAESAACWGSMYEAAHAALIARASDALTRDGATVYLDPALASGPLRFEIDEILLRREPRPAIEWRAAGSLAPDDLERAIFFTTPLGRGGLAEPVLALPHQVHVNRFGEELFTTVSAAPALLDTALAETEG